MVMSPVQVRDSAVAGSGTAPTLVVTSSSGAGVPDALGVASGVPGPAEK